MGLKIQRIGRGIPSRKIDNFYFESYLETNDQWIRKRTGIESRYFSDKGPRDLALQSVIDLQLTEEEKKKIKILLVTGLSMEQVMPSVAAFLHGKLKLPPEILTFDMNMACTAFVGSLMVVEPYLQVGESALIVTTEVLSKYLDMEDRSSAILFGDGAAAVLVTKTDSPWHYDIMTLSDEEKLSMVREEYGGDGKIHMDGKDVFRFATFEIPKSIERVKRKHPEPVNHYVIHQANDRILKSVARHFKDAHFYSNISRYGNTSSASIPLALYDLMQEGKGGNVLLCGFGAGMNLGSVVVEL